MAFVNVIRGQEIPEAPLNVRTPILRIPLWLALAWWCLRKLAALAVTYIRYWWLTLPATGLGWLYLEHGWPGPTIAAASAAVVVSGWAFLHAPSFLRLGWWPVKAKLRRWQYRRVWHPAMATAKLTVSWDDHTIVPIIRRVRCVGGVDLVTVRMVRGQIPDDYAKVSERLAHTFGVRQVKVSPGSRADLVVLTLMRGDPLAAIVNALPVGLVPDFMALPVGLREDGGVYRLRLFGTQILIVGATGAGKGSVVWSIVRALAGGVASGLVQLWGIDPKGGMELGLGRPLFARFAAKDFTDMVTMLEDAAAEAARRAEKLGGHSRQHTPTETDPLIVLVIDELATLTAYLTDRQLKDRVKAALGVLLTKGRAVGVHVVAAIQDPRKEVLPFRDLFPTRIGLRLTEAPQVDMVLGDGMRDRGALCDRIPTNLPGIGYVVLDGDPTPMRVRFGYQDDDDIRALAHDYGRLRLIGGEAA